jgi:hypothetical protein
MSVAAMIKTPSRALHGGSFETSPKRKNGEVSKAPLKPQAVANLPIQQTGTAVAINYLTIGVAAHLPCSSNKGGARNRADRESHALTSAQIANLESAERHARAIGLPFTRMITIHWQSAGVAFSDMVKATGRFLDMLTKWLTRQKCKSAWLWVNENGHKKGYHCHLLAHIPAALVSRLTGLQKGWLKRISGNKYKNGVIYSKPIGGRLGLETNNPALYWPNIQKAFAYVCKGAPQAVLNAHGIERQHAPGGHIIGRRCSTSQNIAAKARKSKD